MALSARNGLPGTVVSAEKDGVMAGITLELGDGQTITSTATRASADRLDLAAGDSAAAVIKASEVMMETGEAE
ncbi:TOBE domain-containing protein [Halobellus ruber]|uniref:TOBE domain-containing protein n=1 Tax=Halobellus ruber TaxID=2761102 RepID=A0A7J9SJL1_9EURY|nr:TOBE domain-containing protein [Halobellus ruber]MBB6645201.1 TOBE domain-containing protein [Halobellus ruber]